MKKLDKAIITIALLIPLSAACSNEHSESCEWERKSTAKHAMVADFGSKGGTSGGRGGSSGSRGGSSGGGSKLGKSSSSGGSGGASKPRYNKSNPAPKPSSPAGSGMKWEWDCE